MAYGAILGQTPQIPENPNTVATNVSYNNSSTSSIITGDNVQEAIDQLFTSVSNGKTQIASAITDKGVSTSANDTFQQMAINIDNISNKEYFVTSWDAYYGTQIKTPFTKMTGTLKAYGGVWFNGLYCYIATGLYATDAEHIDKTDGDQNGYYSHPLNFSLIEKSDGIYISISSTWKQGNCVCFILENN